MPYQYIDHPTNSHITASYGWDHAVEFFVTILEDDYPRAEYDKLQSGYSDLNGAIGFFAEHGFFAPEDIHAAKNELAHSLPDELEGESLRRCAQVILSFRRASD